MALEKRAHARVAALINARVVDAAGETEFPVRDISKGGIFVTAKQPLAPLGGRVQLKLALTAGIRPIMVSAEVARLANVGPDHAKTMGTGLRFLFESDAQQAQIIELMDRSMLGPGTDRRAFPRVYVLLNVLFRTRTEKRTVLRDLSEGGAGLWLENEAQVNEEVSLELARTGHPVLKLDGWVASCEKIAGEPSLYRAGVRFSRLTPQLRQELIEFLKQQYRR
ncbi:MAG: PilZ domain-containing protein [Myxococcaceae bacterium]